MNKQEYRKHCEEQIERCIRLNDSKHLKEHELSLGLLNENEHLIENKNNLIKYLEDKIKECQNTIEMLEGTGSHRIPLLSNRIYTYEDVLERVKSGKYE